MRTLLTSTSAILFLASSAAVSLACPMHSAGHEQSMTVAEAQSQSSVEGMSTFDPEKLPATEEKKEE